MKKTGFYGFAGAMLGIFMSGLLLIASHPTIFAGSPGWKHIVGGIFLLLLSSSRFATYASIYDALNDFMPMVFIGFIVFAIPISIYRNAHNYLLYYGGTGYLLGIVITRIILYIRAARKKEYGGDIIAG